MRWNLRACPFYIWDARTLGVWGFLILFATCHPHPSPTQEGSDGLASRPSQIKSPEWVPINQSTILQRPEGKHLILAKGV